MAHILLVGTLIQPFTHNEREYFRLQLAEEVTDNVGATRREVVQFAV